MQTDDELHQELDEGPRMRSRLGGEAEGHCRDVPVCDHANKFDETDEALSRDMPTEESASPFCVVRLDTIVGELVKPIDARTGF